MKSESIFDEQAATDAAHSSTCDRAAAAGPQNALTPAAQVEFLRLMALAREGDRREGICFRQGLGAFQLPGAGHEALAIIGRSLRDGDLVFPHYRDRALMLALGMTTYDLALDFFAKDSVNGGGRQLASHFGDKRRNVFSYASPTGLQCLPAAGAAWAMSLRGESNLVVCCVGDATVRQGEFYEALAFALQEKLPIIFIVEDNAYGISTPTKAFNPYRIGALAEGHAIQIDGRDPAIIFDVFDRCARRARSGQGPSVVWAEVDRLLSHTSSDDQRIYRSVDEIAAMSSRDPIARLSKKLIAEGWLDAERWSTALEEIAASVDDDYQQALSAPEPSRYAIGAHTFASEPPRSYQSGLTAGSPVTMLQAVNQTLRDLLRHDERVVLFGEDIADPKGGVFGITKGLSSLYPARVFNSPLAEATIIGVGAGLAACGLRPIVELQFIDFVGPGFHQLANQIATLRWRTKGQWSCPLVIIAPCGGYLPSGGPWHSQSNEGWFAHIPGLQVVVPSRPEDAAALLRAAIGGNDPVLYLLPKHLLRMPRTVEGGEALRIGLARVARSGGDVTVIAWGNTVSIALEAADALVPRGIDVEVIDLRSIVPCDWSMLEASLEKTGRLVVVQEDNRTCSFGQAIISELTSRVESWSQFSSPPQLVTREDVHVAFNASVELATLPDSRRVIEAIEQTIEF